MSRIGNKPIELPSGVTFELQGNRVTIKGSKGTLQYELPTGISAEQQDNAVVVTRESDAQQVRAYHGLARSLISNMAEGVSNGFEKRLEIIGVGYRAQAGGKNITLHLGFSHPVEMKTPEGVTVEMDPEEKNIIIIKGFDKQAVGEFAANIRKLREPEPYKGKGIRYVGERVRRKAGKAAASAASA